VIEVDAHVSPQQQPARLLDDDTTPSELRSASIRATWSATATMLLESEFRRQMIARHVTVPEEPQLRVMLGEERSKAQ